VISPYWNLAHLSLARAYAMGGDTDKARGMYREFLALWKNADPDIPILLQAKKEYAEFRKPCSAASTLQVHLAEVRQSHTGIRENPEPTFSAA
jgi:hypothetical protein